MTGKNKSFESKVYSMRDFEFFTEVKMMIVVLWVVTPCGLAGGYQRFGGTLNPVDGGDRFLRDVSNHIQNYTASQPRGPQSIPLLGNKIYGKV
jgi:hypothetical protein